MQNVLLVYNECPERLRIFDLVEISDDVFELLSNNHGKAINNDLDIFNEGGLIEYLNGLQDPLYGENDKNMRPFSTEGRTVIVITFLM
jgi:hypothetical protein